MSILTNVAIPIVSRSLHHLDNKVRHDQISARRTYNDGPLPTRPSDHAPRQAHIVGRVAEHGVALYHLRIGDILITDVGLNEVLDYVSPRELEEFETRQFEEEGKVLRIAEIMKQAELEEARERAIERAKRKGTVMYQDLSDQSSSDEGRVADVPLGRHGRARPSYTHLYKASKERRRRKRDPVTGELMPLSDEDAADAMGEASSQDEALTRPTLLQQTSAIEIPRRRRRKRDKITGELLPLSPDVPARSTVLQSTEPPQLISQRFKRPRRRRHPITKVLMPLGWRYDPEAEDETERLEVESDADVAAPSLARNDSARDGPDIKRLKLTSDTAYSSSAESSFPAQRHLDIHGPPPRTSQLRNIAQSRPDILSNSADVNLFDPGTVKVLRPDVSSQGSIIVSPPDVLQRKDRSVQPGSGLPKNLPLKQVTLASFLASNRDADRSSPTSASASESEKEVTLNIYDKFVRDVESAKSTGIALTSQNLADTPYRKQRLTKLQRASITNASTAQMPNDAGPRAESEDKLDENEWFVEAILDHRPSDPRTHPPALGKKPVMLYRTKWRDYDEPTWEPEESFIDREVLESYRHKARLGPGKVALGVKQALAPAGKAYHANRHSSTPDKDQEDYEVEEILSHHLSDPRTHSLELGGDPVMLYLVKWVGYDTPTWEPIESFADRSIVEEYHRQSRRRDTQGR